jgi:sterol desaturase/sphingolipid hydroxylase (fatty acid hydroxylase superfamily)
MNWESISTLIREHWQSWGFKILASGVSLVALAVVFLPLEKAFPAKQQKFFRPQWFTDLGFFMGQYLLWSGLVFVWLEFLHGWIGGWAPGAFRAAVAAQPWWLQAVEAFFLGDLLIYWGHRLQHQLPGLWSFHSVHHSVEHLDWLAAHREHPIDTIYTTALVNLPPLLMGFRLEPLAGLVIFRGVWAIYIHSNVKLPLGPLRMLVGAPELHHWHHAKERFAGNYGNVSPLMDLLFGTYRHPGHEPAELGVVEPMPKTYLGHMMHPFKWFWNWLRSLGRTKEAR